MHTAMSASTTFAERVRIELTWVLPQPWLSMPVPYHFGLRSFYVVNIVCGEPRNRTLEPFTANCFQDSFLDQPDTLQLITLTLYVEDEERFELSANDLTNRCSTVELFILVLVRRDLNPELLG